MSGDDALERIVRDPDRLEAVRRTGLLDTPPERAFDRLTRLAAALLDTPVAVFSLTDDSRHFFKSQYGMPSPYAEERQRPLAVSFCQRALARTSPLVITDAKSEPSLREHPAVLEFGIGGYVGVPLITSSGDRLGTFCVMDMRPRLWTERDVQLGCDLAQAVVTEIELRMRTREAEAARADADAARRLAEEASRAKDEFLAMLGHELRNPLAPISTALHLMELRGPNHLVKERGVIERQVRHLSMLVDDLLDVSRITRGKAELRLRRIELAGVVAKGVELASPLLEQRAHRLHVRVAPELVIEADEQRLAQVVANLLTNAAKYTKPGGNIEVIASRDGGEAVLRVKDDGIGIAPELLAQVFDLFVQGKSGADGLGIGLAIVRGLVELHCGSVCAHSAGLGQGSEFTVRIPLASAAAVSLGATTIGAPVAIGAAVHRVLVVDDNRDAADTLELALRAMGYDVIAAYDGPAALELARSSAPTVALIDLDLPAMDGYELAAALRAVPQLAHVPVVAVTGYGQDTDRARTSAAGFAAHLVKPVELSRIQQILDALPLGQSRAAVPHDRSLSLS